MGKPKYQRWPYGRGYFNAPKPAPSDFDDSLGAIAKLMDKCVDEFSNLQEMRKRGGEGSYLRALARTPELRAAFARWVRAARSVSTINKPEADEGFGNLGGG